MSAKRHRHRVRRARTTLQKRAQGGFRGYPIATIAYYGPDDKFASKVAVGIILQEDGDVAFLERWFAEDSDIRVDPSISRQIVEFINSHNVRSVVITDGIIGCPHEEGIDYPEGENCPQCPYWADRDRWTGEPIAERRGKRLEEVVVMGVAWYRREQWQRLREISADGDELGATHEEWERNAEKSLREMLKAGMYPEKVEIDVEELLHWCNEQDRPVDAGARAQYTAEKLAQRQAEHNDEIEIVRREG